MRAAPLANRIADVLEESGASPEVAATALASVLGSVCREGRTDLDVAVGIARITSEIEIKCGDRSSVS